MLLKKNIYNYLKQCDLKVIQGKLILKYYKFESFDKTLLLLM